MRKLAFVLALLPMVACSTASNTGLTEEQRNRGIKSVRSLSSSVEGRAFRLGLLRSFDGRSNAFGRDMGKIGDFFNRHIWNYDANDPYINHPTDTNRLHHIGRAGLGAVASTPVVGDVLGRVTARHTSER